jgi:hypothetical protein
MAESFLKSVLGVLNLATPKSSIFTNPSRANHDVWRLDISMDNSRFMGSRQSGPPLASRYHYSFRLSASLHLSTPKSSTVNELSAIKLFSIDLTDFVNGQYIWMVQR